MSPSHAVFDPLDTFPRRHIGPDGAEIAKMCKVLGVASIEELVEKTVPEAIRIQQPTRLGPGVPESEVLERLKYIASKNKVYKSYIGMGYTGTITPKVILRNIMENPGWYTQVGALPDLATAGSQPTDIHLIHLSTHPTNPKYPKVVSNPS